MTYDYDPEDCTCQKTGVYFERKTEDKVESRRFVPWGHISSLSHSSTGSNAGVAIGIFLIILGLLFIMFLPMYYGFFFTLILVLIGVLAIILGARSESELELTLDSGEEYKISKAGKRTEAAKAMKTISDLFDEMKSHL